MASEPLTIDVEALLSPISADAPCGADPEYSADFLALQEAGAGKPETQYGDHVAAAVEPAWRDVRALALQLAAQTRDLRVGVWLLRSSARLQDWPGVGASLALLQGYVERHWNAVHPQLDASDGNDPTMRLNAFAPLLQSSDGLADLRGCGLFSGRGAVRVRDVELTLVKGASPFSGESLPAQASVLEALAGAIAGAPALADSLAAPEQAVRAIAAAIEHHIGTGIGPDFAPLLTLVGAVAQAGRRIAGSSASAAVDEAASVSTSGVVSVAVPGELRTRADAARALDQVCDWLERNEPSHPAPLLLRRAQRLIDKSFLDIIRDLLPDRAETVERLAGPAPTN